jgi:hypothetical protein
MKNGEHESSKRFAFLASHFFIFLRGAVPLLLVLLALLAIPILAVWWLRGGPFDVNNLLLGGAASIALLIGLGLILAWAVGQIGGGRRG